MERLPVQGIETHYKDTTVRQHRQVDHRLEEMAQTEPRL